ncbi:hypothetical protein KW782_02780 [Candidatus Parcubacteria bacterium]|nr:hypothetical protein [Candidatus Parcubacteria bacterium]
MLSPARTQELITSGEIVIEPFNEKMFKPGSYSFTLGNKYKKLKPVSVIDSRVKEQEFEEAEIGPDGYELKPGEFIICHTAETLRLGQNTGCFLTMRGARAQTGLDFLHCEIFCEPGSAGGWDGKLMLETTNRGPYPIKLFPGITVIKAIFVTIE